MEEYIIIKKMKYIFQYSTIEIPQAIIKNILWFFYWKRKADKLVKRLQKDNPQIKEWDIYYYWDKWKPILLVNMWSYQL